MKVIEMELYSSHNNIQNLLVTCEQAEQYQFNKKNRKQ
ncbi:unnamed protein product [Paramecium sonneborni]|uniref:Uncharacterized protein n=1 Tax=Paramecium sonneborni TaxID=65129 RepID=A0A8S1RM80_9CILI|nr:unnamed protein product [Paramecium sonneborni]